MRNHYSSLSSSFSNKIVLHSPSQKLNLKFLEDMVSAISPQSQTFIVDPKRIWKLTESVQIKLLRPNSIEELLNSISEMSNYISQRTSLIVVLDYFYYLRDFRGRKATDTAINTRFISYLNGLLSEIGEKHKLMIVIVGYPDPLRENMGLGEQYFEYYDFSVIRLEEEHDKISIIGKDKIISISK